MIPCSCGSKMYRHQKGTLKRSGEDFQRFLCHTCGASLTFYRKDKLHWIPERREERTTGCDDTEFLDALKRFHGEASTVASSEKQRNGQVDLHLVKRQPRRKAAALRVV